MFFHCSMCPDTDQQDNTQFKLPVFEATGEIPKEEALKIHNPNKHARSPLATTQKPARKPKKPKHSHPTKVTNLLDKESSPSPEPDQEPPIVSAQSHPTPHALVVPLSTPNTQTANPSFSPDTTFNKEAQTISPAEVFKPVDPSTQAPFPPPAIQTGVPSGQSDPCKLPSHSLTTHLAFENCKLISYFYQQTHLLPLLQMPLTQTPPRIPILALVG